jgi:nicotinate-nucleotide--dimethylbenzimidazole phosphoribosyltransferase
MAEYAGADTLIVDMGLHTEEKIPGVIDKKIRLGTRNFKEEPAMTMEEASRGILTGIDLVRSCKEKGYQLLATGEMGIGNTTTSSAIAAALLGCKAKEVTGRGAGLDDESLLRKQAVIDLAIEKYRLRTAKALEILCCVGGLDIAGLTGVCIGGGLYRMPIVLDGVISMAAALLAEKIKPGVKAYLLPSHKGKEPAVPKLLWELEMEPVIDGELALGEGTGAVLLFPLLDMALRVYQKRTTFSDLRLSPYERRTK